MILEALRAHDYNQTAAAEAIGISRDALIRRMKNTILPLMDTKNLK